MATAPVKSQPLHNFSLSFLKWGHKNQMNSNHRFRRPSDTMLWDSPPPQAVENHRSSPSEQESDGGGGSGFKNESENPKVGVGSRSAQRNRFSFASCSLQKQQATVFENEEDVEREKEKVWNDVVEGDESVAKPWNLRPRKVVSKAAVEIGGVSRNGEFQESAQQQQTDNLPKSMRLRGFVEGQGSEKRKFWIALSREEIEEDVYAMTGSRPARRPKKRPKTVQKQVDNVFPGLYLAGVSADYYRVHEALEITLLFRSSQCAISSHQYHERRMAFVSIAGFKVKSVAWTVGYCFANLIVKERNAYSNTTFACCKYVDCDICEWDVSYVINKVPRRTSGTFGG
ncbi:hypothetical protein TEA_013762 [Camellia sinensis var. sinensis]|uniref:Uncharacterized protein n=1 Tax=Camellia sinensis var. sinensis TaxID=542762 RepID=A0A4S4D492_CAMSN|nr:hypothetical protein TEA_013762 [Camellia sinensis var. sinensis]